MARMSKDNVGRFFAALAAERPDPTTELAYINAYTLLVAVVLFTHVLFHRAMH